MLCIPMSWELFFSGSAVIDYDNTAGFNKKKRTGIGSCLYSGIIRRNSGSVSLTVSIKDVRLPSMKVTR